GDPGHLRAPGPPRRPPRGPDRGGPPSDSPQRQRLRTDDDSRPVVVVPGIFGPEAPGPDPGADSGLPARGSSRPDARSADFDPDLGAGPGPGRDRPDVHNPDGARVPVGAGGDGGEGGGGGEGVRIGVGGPGAGRGGASQPQAGEPAGEVVGLRA